MNGREALSEVVLDFIQKDFKDAGEKGENMTSLASDLFYKSHIPKLLKEVDKESLLTDYARNNNTTIYSVNLEDRKLLELLIYKANLKLDFMLLKEMERVEDEVNYSKVEDNYFIADELNMDVKEYLDYVQKASLEVGISKEVKRKSIEFEYLKNNEHRKEIIEVYIDLEVFERIEKEREEIDVFYKEELNKGVGYMKLRGDKFKFNNTSQIIKDLELDMICKYYDNSEEVEYILTEFLKKDITLEEANGSLLEFQKKMLGNYELTRDSKLYVEAISELGLLRDYQVEEKMLLEDGNIDRFHDQTLSASISECPGIEHEEIKQIEKDMENIKNLYQELRKRVINKEEIKYPRKNLVNELIEAQKVIDTIEIAGDFKNKDNIAPKTNKKEEYER